jgi:hypothetical protein
MALISLDTATGDFVYRNIKDSTVDMDTGAIKTASIENSAITSAKIAADAIGGAHIASGEINTEHIASGAVQAIQLADNSVDNAAIMSGAVDSNEINADAVLNIHIASGAVQAEQLADDSVDTAAILSGAVKSDEIDADAVLNIHIASGAVQAEQLADNSVDTAAIQDGAVTEAKLASGLSIDIAESVQDILYAAEDLNALDPVYLDSSAQMARADASDPAKNPAIGIVPNAIASGSTGSLALQGKFPGLGMSGSQGQLLYLASGGGLTTDIPGPGAFIQKLGFVGSGGDIAMIQLSVETVQRQK